MRQGEETREPAPAHLAIFPGSHDLVPVGFLQNLTTGCILYMVFIMVRVGTVPTGSCVLKLGLQMAVLIREDYGPSETLLLDRGHCGV